ncbi:hypothetical protein Daesc_003052 [Daldinia eschscholtzii]|uniref:non-specific serine/threonine protein kinase n=1 Tax=Daldinia eschscholtzii TaxID=292717 RepID=A0AAX6MS17_9PEZI
MEYQESSEDSEEPVIQSLASRGPVYYEYDPGNFEDKYRALNWSFSRYREKGAREPNFRQFARYRRRWMAHPFPRQGTPNIREGQFPSFRPFNFNVQGNRNLNQEARAALRNTRDYFEKDAKFKYIRYLGFGGLGLTIHYKWKGSQIGREDRDIVMKLGLIGWLSTDISDEEEALRQMAGAAHVLQAIDPAEVQLPPQNKFPFRRIDRHDSSSGEDDGSSGEESRSDTEAPEPPSRRWQLENEPERMLEKRTAHEERIQIRRREIGLWDENARAIAKARSKGQSVDPTILEEWDIDHKDYLLLEFMELGDLAHVITKITRLNDWPPNRVFWSFWNCLVKACIAMEYPPRKFHPRRRRRPEDHATAAEIDELARRKAAGEDVVVGRVSGKDLEEEIPVSRRRWAGKRMVHLDIDPRNILIAPPDYNAADSEHRLIPRLKLADFGFAKYIKRNKRNSYYLEKRRYGKHGYFAPEQFGADWEYIAPTDPYSWELSEQPVAGNYTSATNVWGIAWCMWQLMTGLRVPLAPQIQQVPENEPVHYCPVLLDDNEYNDIDRELRETVAQCMRHDPRDRPSLLDLANQADRGTRKEFPDEDDDYIDAWVQRIFFEAPEYDSDEDERFMMNVFGGYSTTVFTDSPPQQPAQPAQGQGQGNEGGDPMDIDG